MYMYMHASMYMYIYACGGRPTISAIDLGFYTTAFPDQEGKRWVLLLQLNIVLLNEISGE